MSAHARCSASAAHRWMICPGSLGKGGDPSIHSATGTFAHDIAAKCLVDDSVSPSDFFLQKGKVDGFEIECDMEMVDGVRVYVDAVNDDHEDGDEGEVEMSLLEPLQTIDKDLGGTADFVRYRPSTRHLRVWDFKYGSGTYVEADNNAQMKVYALGALVAMAGKPIEDVTVTICQPRFEGAAPVRDFHFKAVELLEFAADVQEACERTRQPEPAIVAGDHCKFCPKARTCKKLEEKQHALIAAEFGPVAQYDTAKLAEALANVALVKQRIAAIESFAYAEATRGVEIPGFKLVQKEARRKWKSEGEVILFGQEKGIDVYAPREVLSPNQVEEKLKAAAPRGKKKEAYKAIEHLYERVSSGTALVPVSDERPPAKLVGASDFPALPA